MTPEGRRAVDTVKRLYPRGVIADAVAVLESQTKMVWKRLENTEAVHAQARSEFSTRIYHYEEEIEELKYEVRVLEEQLNGTEAPAKPSAKRKPPNKGLK